jgi:hypothetical protein
VTEKLGFDWKIAALFSRCALKISVSAMLGGEFFLFNFRLIYSVREAINGLLPGAYCSLIALFFDFYRIILTFNHLRV